MSEPIDYTILADEVAAIIKQERSANKIIFDLFPKQRAFVDDKCRWRAALIGRRGGKSWGGAIWLIQGAQAYPASIVPYIALTRKSARNIMWPIFHEINAKYALGFDMLESSLTVKLPNKSEIQLFGADQQNFIERLRGPKYPRALIDECGFFGSHLETLVDDVLTHSLSDYNGPLAMMGSPGVRPAGIFYDITTDKRPGWSCHRWSVNENTYLPHLRQVNEDLRLSRNWAIDNPTYRREVLGEWVLDLDALVYKFSSARNIYRDIPNGDWEAVMGLDLGYDDPTSWTVVLYSIYHPILYVVHNEAASSMIPSQIAERTRQLIDKYSVSKVVADTGGLGKSICEELRIRFSLPIEPAEKKEKLTAISLLNGDLAAGNMLIHEGCRDLIEQYETLTKNEKGMEDPLLPNDRADSTLYAAREAKHWANMKREQNISRDGNDWMKRQEEAEAEEMQQRKQTEWNDAQAESEVNWWDEIT